MLPEVGPAEVGSSDTLEAGHALALPRPATRVSAVLTTPSRVAVTDGAGQTRPKA
jgi:hypothetical protein